VEIEVLNRQRSRQVSPTGLATFLRRVVHQVPAEVADGFTVCLVSDRRMREYNRTYRGMDAVTDVLLYDVSPNTTKAVIIMVAKTGRRIQNSEIFTVGSQGLERQNFLRGLAPASRPSARGAAARC